ncbi:hypothetical protein BELL_0021g00320 [Botrytis elliptica]|uniref:Uncharacterized protein n=1 Tax=Botrytis elliptica TaxID=278938 RepID=A0A4Z1K230_9HELO|nr:hypothetical protein EAE99_000363 [Botrytis elliptica]TGO79858.1 hypothetical protein BELL_0021g00320 [Botrytis elliptica]
MAPGPSPLSTSFSDSARRPPAASETLKQACRNLERRMIEEEEKRMWAAVTAGKSIKATKRWKGRSPAGSGSSENRRKN